MVVPGLKRLRPNLLGIVAIYLVTNCNELPWVADSNFKAGRLASLGYKFKPDCRAALSCQVIILIALQFDAAYNPNYRIFQQREDLGREQY